MAKQLKRRFTSELGQLNYLLYLPDDYYRCPQRSWPLVVFLHGWGESGEDLELLKYHGIPRVIEDSSGFPFVAVSPQAPADKEWQALTGLLIHFVCWVSKNHRVNHSRIYLTGLSTGGKGVWALAVENPDVFAAVVPMAADLPNVEGFLERVEALYDVPVWVFHGARDDVYPVENTDSIVARLRSAQGDVRYTVYPDAGHIAWPEAYRSPDLYDWLLNQARST